MIENILELVVGQLLDAIYFALFLIFTKNILENSNDMEFSFNL